MLTCSFACSGHNQYWIAPSFVPSSDDENFEVKFPPEDPSPIEDRRMGMSKEEKLVCLRFLRCLCLFCQTNVVFHTDYKPTMISNVLYSMNGCNMIVRSVLRV